VIEDRLKGMRVLFQFWIVLNLLFLSSSDVWAALKADSCVDRFQNVERFSDRKLLSKYLKFSDHPERIHQILSEMKEESSVEAEMVLDDRLLCPM